MLDWATALSTWLADHPASLAWAMGWIAALSISQLIKQFLPLDWSEWSASRLLQSIAIFSGSATCYALWPSDSVHSFLFSVIVGMSAPTAYTLLKAIVSWRAPGLARRLSWSDAKNSRCTNVRR